MTTRKPLRTSLNNRIDALLGIQNQESGLLQQAKTIAVELLVLPKYQPRQYFDLESISSLAESIGIHGILEPLLVRPVVEGKYEIVAGGRRYRAAQLLGLTEVPAIILNLTDNEALEVAILENIQRENLNPLEETFAILRLLSVRLNWEQKEVISLLYRLRNDTEGELRRNVSPNSEVGIVETIFKTFGITPKSFVETRLPLLKLPSDILEFLQLGKIAYTKVILISKLKDEEERVSLLNEVIEKNLGVREIKERLKQLQGGKKESPVITVKELMKSVEKKKLWETEPRKWAKVQKLLDKIKILLED
jgi:ParB family chromosome partitioning protein